MRFSNYFGFKIYYNLEQVYMSCQSCQSCQSRSQGDREYPSYSLPNQKGGAASAYRHGAIGAMSISVDPRALSEITLRNIDRSPMFNPLQTGTVIPTGLTGILPEGIYYMNEAQLKCMADRHGVKRYKRNEFGQLIPYTQNELIQKIKGKGIKFYC